jgi:hypothetical protein
MESLVVTLETAKKLKAAGFPQTTADYWLKQPKWAWRVGLDKYSATNRNAAPTAQEIADQLPSYAKVRKNVDRYFADAHGLSEPVVASTMAEALALLWLKLQEAK